MNRDDIVSLSLEEMLSELAKDVAKNDRLNLGDYYQLLTSAQAFTLVPIGSDASEGAVGFENQGIHYILLFMRQDVATDVARRCRTAIAVPVAARDALRRVPPAWGVIADWGTSAELTLPPASIVEFNERFRIWPVRQEATEDWLVGENASMAARGVDAGRRAPEATRRWAQLNGFPVLAESRRARRIEHFFAVYGDGDPVGRAARGRDRWRLQYESDPYLHHLDAVDLDRRLRTILKNQLFVDRGALPHELTSEEWQELFVHLDTEYSRRGLSLASAIKRADISAAWPQLRQGEAVIAAYSGPSGQLFRFSKLKFLKPLYELGELTIFPAARYSDASLLRSQHDNELARTVLADGTKARIEHTDRAGVRHEMNAIGSIKYQMASRTNYYVWFTTTVYDARLYDDFDADACLIIHDAERFIGRLFRAVSAALPRWVGAEKLVRYFDPLRAHGEVLASFEKDFDYAYQREFRFVWNPPAPDTERDLPPLSITLGPLTDVCSLVAL